VKSDGYSFGVPLQFIGTFIFVGTDEYKLIIFIGATNRRL
jgi:hypothetical protein